MHTMLRFVAALTLALVTVPTLAATATFSGHEFELVGSANLNGSDLQLTPPLEDRAGAAWLTTALPSTDSFSVSFRFSLLQTDFFPMADGISFAIQPEAPTLVGAGGGEIGLGGLGAVASVIQTWDNNRVGFTLEGDPFDAAQAPALIGYATLLTGFQYIAYDAGNHMLTMTGSLNFDGDVYAVSDTLEVDLASRFSGQPVFIGFTGGTGLSYADQRITAFELNPAPVPEPGAWALLLAGMAVIGVGRRFRRMRRI